MQILELLKKIKAITCLIDRILGKILIEVVCQKYLENIDFEKYADFSLNYPMLFIKRRDEYIDAKIKLFKIL